MPNLKISQLTGGGAAQAADEFVVARSGGNNKVTGANVAAAATSVGTLTSLTVSGDVTVDTNTLFVDATNNRVGIGTASPSTQLQVGSAGVIGVQTQRDGNGNTFTPQMAQLVQSGVAAMSVQVLDGTGNKRVGLFMDATNNIAGINVNYSFGAPNFVYSVGTTEIFRATPDGSFGVGTNNPFYLGVGQASSTISGSVSARLLLEDTGWESSGDGVGSLLYNDGAFSFVTASRSGSNTTGSTTRMTLDASGNLGLGVTPSAWGNAGALQLQNNRVIAFSGNTGTIAANAFFDTGWKYIASSHASLYLQASGEHQWRIAPSGTAGNAITFTQAMTLDASGRLGIGVTSPSAPLHVDAGSGGEYFRGAGNSGAARHFNITASTTTNAGDTHTLAATSATGVLALATAGLERARIDNNGGLLVGLSVPRAVALSASARHAIATTASAALSVASYAASNNGCRVMFGKSRATAVTGTAALQSGDEITLLRFGGDDGTNMESVAAGVLVEVDGTVATGSIPGRIRLATTTPGGTSYIERMRVDSLGNVVINQAAIATSATDGFLYVPSCAGTPTGTPTTYTGRVPIVVDTTNHKLYFYSGAQWRDAGP